LKIRRLPSTSWDISDYNLDYYGYGDVDVFINKDRNVGERVICIFRSKDIERYYNDKYYDKTLAILCNDCGVESGIEELMGLNAGQIIPVEFNGPENPTIPLNWIESKFWEL